LSPPVAVAITGGIGAGKSTALASFRHHGAATVSSDEIVHHLLATDPEVKEKLVERLGEEILGDDGAPDRERIAIRVFKDRDALDFLEKLLHPLPLLSAEDRFVRISIARDRQQHEGSYVRDRRILDHEPSSQSTNFRLRTRRGARQRQSGLR